MKTIRSIALVMLAVAAPLAAHASEVGHYSPGLPSIRDLILPDPGIYGVVYTYSYMSDRINDKNGDEIKQIAVPVDPTTVVPVDLDVDLDLYIVAPGAMWSSDYKILGARYGAYALVPLANTSIGASLTTATGTARSGEESQFGLSDMFVQPLWLGWNKPHLAVALGYGVYLPVGKYDTEEVTIPDVGTFTAESRENIGLGFWTHQFQGAGAWFPWPDRRMAVVGGLTWEVHSEKQDFDLTPGQSLAFNWGVSEYLPLKKDNTLIGDVGIAGYDSWQISEDSGDDARNAEVKDQVHGAGFQAGAIYTPLRLSASLRFLFEFSAEDRFQGQSIGLNFGIGF
ncbi:MAG: transporter [Candidatus Eisenbacteria bacterium]|nr:transporter [Candidatus Eisenbacteria bacterium]